MTRDRIRARRAAVKAMADHGMSVAEIARELDTPRPTIRNDLHAATSTVDEPRKARAAKARAKASETRPTAGCTAAPAPSAGPPETP